MSKRSDIIKAKIVDQEGWESQPESVEWIIDSGPRQKTIRKQWYVKRPKGDGKTAVVVPVDGRGGVVQCSPEGSASSCVD